MRAHLIHVLLVLASLGLLAAHEITDGRVSNANGRGWDGVGYAAMLDDLSQGTANTRLRPAIAIATRPAYYLLADPIAAFRLMNYVYLALLAWAVALLGQAYGLTGFEKAYLVITLALSIATAQMFAFYPVLVDLGAYAVVTLAVYAAVRGWPVASGVLAVLSVLSRELGVAVLAFGVHRELRRHGDWRRALAIYGPAAVAGVLWRLQVARSLNGSEMLSIAGLSENLRLWADPMYVAAFGYFAVTVFGGVSLIVAANPSRAFRFMRLEPEWATYGAVIAAATVIGNADIWRYLAYALPLATVLFACCCRGWTPRQRIAPFAIGAVATFVTQHPFDALTDRLYFRDWFPYYLWGGLLQIPEVSLWPLWGWRFLACAAALWLLLAFGARSDPPRVES